MKKRSVIILPAIAVIASFMIIMLDRSEWSYVFTGSFAFDMLVTFISVLLVLFYITWISARLDVMYPWNRDGLTRLAFQTFFGLFIPAFLVLLLTWIQYEFIYQQSMVATGFIYAEFPFIVLMLAITNLVLFIVQIIPKKPLPESPSNTTLLARRGKKNFAIAPDRIALITIEPTIRLITLEGESFLLTENLDHYERELPANDFFRVNRQILVSRTACQSFQSIENGKISIEVAVKYDDPIIVSQKRAARFRAWMREGAYTSA